MALLPSAVGVTAPWALLLSHLLFYPEVSAGLTLIEASLASCLDAHCSLCPDPARLTPF